MTAARTGIFLMVLMAASVTAAATENPDWLTIFDEQFADNPLQRFQTRPVLGPGVWPTNLEGSGQYDAARHAYSLGGRLSLVRPVRAGAHVELSLALRFEPPSTDAPPDLETDLTFLLVDGTMAGIQVQRSKQSDVPSVVRFVQDQPGQARTKVLREIQMPGAPPDGVWVLRYRHGLLTLVQGTETVGKADIAHLGVSVAGVSWSQKGGLVACEQMTLKGEPFRELAAADQETLQRASQLNAEAQILFRDKKSADALPIMEEASALYLKVHGENHHDSANSFANLASVFGSIGKGDEAGKFWAKALAIHEATLGPTHPHTTLTRFNFGKNFLERGDKAKAKELWTRCRDDWTAVFGPDYPIVRSLDSILPNL